MVCSAAVLTALPASGRAQEAGAVALGGGYSFLGSDALVDGYGLGWFAEGGWRATNWLDLVAEVSRQQRTQDVGFIDVEVTFGSVLAGPRLWLDSPGVAPFAHLLAGATRLNVRAGTSVPVDSTGTDAATYGTLQLGGGIQIPLADRLSLRVGADYRRVFTEAGLNQSRFATGAVYRFGEL